MGDLRQLLLTPEQAADMDAPGSKDAAVLVPLAPDPWTITLTERRPDLSRHAGEISFPGGRQDEPDEDLRATALREAHETLRGRVYEALTQLDGLIEAAETR